MVAYSKMQYLLAAVGRRSGRSNAEIRRTLAQLLPCEPRMSDDAINTAERRDREGRGPAWRKRRVDAGSLTLSEQAALLRALGENCVRYTVSGATRCRSASQKRLVAPSRSRPLTTWSARWA